MLSKFADVDPNEDPLIILQCGRAFTISTLDGILSMDQYYLRGGPSAEAPYVACKPPPEAMWDRSPTCPHCRSPITDMKRYGRPLRKAALDVTNKKFVSKWTARIKIADTAADLAARATRERNKEELERLGRGYSGAEELDRARRWKKETKEELSERMKKGKPHHLQTLFTKCGVSDADQLVWANFVAPLEEARREYEKILQGCKNFPIMKVYEAAVSMVERQREEDEIARNLGTLGITSEPTATAHASEQDQKAVVALPLPKPDSGMLIRCVFSAVQLELTLAELISERVFLVIASSTSACTDAWSAAIMAIFYNCESEISAATDLACEGDLKRLEAQAYLLAAETMYRRLDFCLHYPAHVMGLPADGAIDKDAVVPNLRGDARLKFAQMIDLRVKVLMEQARRTVPPSSQSVIEERTNVIASAMQKCLSRAQSEFYEHVTREEMIAVFRAMSAEFVSAGHCTQSVNAGKRCKRASVRNAVRLLAVEVTDL
ncbi:hypothetical protein HK104_007278 [Borealophlyctis nickersoniae]|nr:hypothetical protein HK104_007278 [Borealophlyctis nickersoniae]